ncbi:ABC transporter substrate-binding protein [Halotalea alkalilenta]|uniref:ABC transporter substrate-binding protein n=1 Tax=Halotalea alkalilenta TaxID=376489 RepID=UPI000481CAFB|nr:spermidine/putrescine ABC transporter substrate-binding protein [Halotalea alkalilenta]
MNKKRSSSLIAGLGALLLVTQAQAQETLYLFNWSEYMDPEIIQQFEQRYDVKVVQSYYGSLGEMFSRLQSGGTSQFDIIVPSNYYVPRLIGAGLVQPLDKSKLSNAGNVMEQFADPSFDPGLEYSIPYQWGTTGIVYDTTAFPDAKPSWSLLFDPEVNPTQPFAIQQDGQVMIGAACAYLGKGGDCTSLDDWRAAAQLVLETRQRSNFSGFVDGTPVLQQVARGTVKAGITYNGDFLLKKDEDPEGFANLAFMLPEEGAEMWVDSMMIPKNAPHPELAHKFIDFIMEPEIGAQLSNYNQYSSPNQAAEPLLDDALREPPSLPTDEQMAHLYFSPSLEGAQLQQFQQLWNEVRSR